MRRHLPHRPEARQRIPADTEAHPFLGERRRAQAGRSCRGGVRVPENRLHVDYRLTPSVVGTALDAARITNEMRRVTPELKESIRQSPRPPSK